MSAEVTEATRTWVESIVEFELAQDLWDLPPVLFVSCRLEGVEEPGTWMIAFTGGVHPADAMRFLASDLSEGPWQTISELNSITLRSEGWGLTHELARADAEKWAGRISQHPERQEMKFFVSVDSEGCAGTMFSRNNPELIITPSDQLEGVILEALYELFGAVKALVNKR